MEQNKELKIGDLVYLTCDIEKRCLMTISNVSDTLCSVVFLDNNHIPQSIDMLDKRCVVAK
jgi:hypothetical protein